MIEIIGKFLGNRPVQHRIIHLFIDVKGRIKLTNRFPDKVLLKERLGQGGAEPLLNDTHYFFKREARLQEKALCLRGDEPELQGLTPQAYRNWKIGGCHRLMADIHYSVSDPIGDAGEKHALEPPVREKDQLLILPRSVGQHVAEYTAQQIGFHPAEPAGKKMIRLLQGSRRPALGALMFNE